MTRHSQNGWPVVAKAACDQGPFSGVKFPNGILAGDVAVIARWQLQRYIATVEPIVAGSCWGWFDKKIEGSTTISNHASATAWDINAEQHPMGAATARTMDAEEIAACRRIVTDSKGVLRWGGDYTGRPDAMHWEIVGTPAQAHAFANQIRAAARPKELIVLTGKVPLVGEGDNDALINHPFKMITRIQLLKRIPDDGIWGPQTTKAVGAKKMTPALYMAIFGLTP